MFFQTLGELKEYTDRLNLKPEEQLMVLVADNSANEIYVLFDYLNSKGIIFFGGIYPGLLVGEEQKTSGFIAEKVLPIYSSIVLPYLMRFKLDIEKIKNSTALVLVDGLTDKFKDLTDTVYNKLENNVKYIGGGAGFHDLNHRPCIFDNNGLHKDVLYLCIIKEEVNLEVEHGWNFLEGPFLAKSTGNTISTLNGYSAFDVYKDVLEDTENIIISKEDFFLFAKDHPFGIIQLQNDIVVRDPISINSANEIVCVADIPDNCEVYVLKGDTKTLLNSSEKIALELIKNEPPKYLPLLFDCISRAMYLEDKFTEELQNIQKNLKYPLIGALSIGEISSNKIGELKIHNKSTVLGLLTIND